MSVFKMGLSQHFSALVERNKQDNKNNDTGHILGTNEITSLHENLNTVVKMVNS